MLGYSSGVSYETSSQKVNIARLERKREELRREREISAGIRGQAEGCGQAHDTISELRLRAAEWAKMKVRSEERNEQLHADLERLIKDVSESHPCNRRLDLGIRACSRGSLGRERGWTRSVLSLRVACASNGRVNEKLQLEGRR